MEITKIVTKNLKEAKITNAMTQKEVAQSLNMSQQQYSRFENGKYELNYQQIVALCKLLNITPNDLFDFN